MPSLLAANLDSVEADCGEARAVVLGERVAVVQSQVAVGERGDRRGSIPATTTPMYIWAWSIIFATSQQMKCLQ